MNIIIQKKMSFSMRAGKNADKISMITWIIIKQINKLFIHNTSMLLGVNPVLASDINDKSVKRKCRGATKGNQ